MNPMQQHFPNPKELRLAAVERTLADSKAGRIDTNQKLEILLNGFKHLEKLMLEQRPLPLQNYHPLTSLLLGLTHLDVPPLRHYHLILTEIVPGDRHSLILVKPTYAFLQTLSLRNKLKSSGPCPT